MDNDTLRRYAEGKQDIADYKRKMGIPEPKPLTKPQKKAYKKMYRRFKEAVKNSQKGKMGNLIHKLILEPSKLTKQDKAHKYFKIAQRIANRMKA